MIGTPYSLAMARIFSALSRMPLATTRGALSAVLSYCSAMAISGSSSTLGASSYRFELVDEVEHLGDGVVELLGDLLPHVDAEQRVGERHVAQDRHVAVLGEGLDALRAAAHALGDHARRPVVLFVVEQRDGEVIGVG